MNRIDLLFARKKQNVLSIYFTAGYPGLHDTGRTIAALEEAGTDLIEVGMPYSDPLADGPTIQASSTASLKNGMTLDLLFTQIAEARKSSQIPLILMGYYNQILQYGVRRFLVQCKETGIDGLIIPDLPLREYETELKRLMDELDLRISFLISPQTSRERIKIIEKLSSGFIYVVSRSSITGARDLISSEQVKYFEEIRSLGLKRPFLIGFGISNRETFHMACRYANGAIIGSAFIRSLDRAGDLEKQAKQFVEKINGP